MKHKHDLRLRGSSEVCVFTTFIPTHAKPKGGSHPAMPGLNIYFACSITGGRQDEHIYQHVVDALQAEGHKVPTAGLASPEVVQLEGVVEPTAVYERDTAWIRECDVLVAEVSTPSHGVGYEIGYALQHAKPVICLYRAGSSISKMILGNRDPRLRVFSYNHLDEAINTLRCHLEEITIQQQGPSGR